MNTTVSVVKLYKLVAYGHKVLLLKTKKTIINRFCSNITIGELQGVSFASSKV
jgi:hypothetical protein